LGSIWFLADFFGSLSGLLTFSGVVLRGVDHGWVEYRGVQGLVLRIRGFTGGLDLGSELGVGVYLYGGLFMVLFMLFI